MRHFNSIIEQSTPPPINSIWLSGGTAKYFTNGKWQVIEGEPKVDAVESRLLPDMLEVTLTEDQFISVLNGTSITLDVPDANSNYDAIVIVVGDYKYYLGRTVQTDGTARYSTNTILAQETSVNLDILTAIITPGTVQISSQYSRITNVVSLEIGNSDITKAANLSRLVPGFFQVQLDYGYGVGTWQPTTGGFAHVTTAYGNEAFYNISIDGSISKDDTYLKPNEPYTVMLEASQIGQPLDQVTAAHVKEAGEIVINGSTGPITYTRTSDSTTSAVYFTDDRKDGRTTLLTYNVSNKTITSVMMDPVIRAATSTNIGGVKQASSVEDIVVSSATAESLAYKLNDLLTSLRSAGIME